MATTMQHMTIEEFAAIDEPGRFDLIRGEVFSMPPAGGEHGAINSKLNRRIGIFVEEHGLGETYTPDTGFILSRSPDTILSPDFSFVRQENVLPREDQRGFLEIAPDLVIEVLSPSDTLSDATTKVMEYLDAGVRLVWLADPADHTVTVYTPDRRARVYREDDHIDGGDVLPGFSIAVADIFR